jgi:hypothetical protein
MARLTLASFEAPPFADLATAAEKPGHRYDGRRKHWRFCTLCESEVARREATKAFKAAARPSFRLYPWPLWREPRRVRTIDTGPIQDWRYPKPAWKVALTDSQDWFRQLCIKRWQAGEHPWTRTTPLELEPVETQPHDACVYCGDLPRTPATAAEHACPVCDGPLAFVV